MVNQKFQNQFRISTIRAQWHDYNGGLYFITICTSKHLHFFGTIENGEMQPSNLGQFVADNLQKISDHYPYAEIPLFAIMPNHLHAIVIIDANSSCRDAARRVSKNEGFANANGDMARHVSTNDVSANANGDVARRVSTNDVSANANGDVARHVSTNDGSVNITGDAARRVCRNSNVRGLLSICIGGFKSAVTRYAHQNHIPFKWQSRFHDRIIRNPQELNQIAEYIENNAANWAL